MKNTKTFPFFLRHFQESKPIQKAQFVCCIFRIGVFGRKCVFCFYLCFSPAFFTRTLFERKKKNRKKFFQIKILSNKKTKFVLLEISMQFFFFIHSASFTTRNIRRFLETQDPKTTHKIPLTSREDSLIHKNTKLQKNKKRIKNTKKLLKKILKNL